MTSKFKNTIVNGTGYLHPVSRPTSARANTITTIIQWTNTGSQTYSVLAGNTPTLTNTSWTAPTGVTSVEVLIVAGGGGTPTGQGGATGGGGAGGLIYNSTFTVTPGQTYTVAVGAGGTAVQGSNSVFNNLITNGTFITDTTGWTSPGSATLSVVSGAIRVTNISTNGRAQSTAFTTIPGRSYIASVTGINRTAANYYFEIRSGVESSDSWASGAVQRTFVAVQSTTYIELYAIGGAGVYAEYDNVSVSEVGSTAIGGGAGGGPAGAVGGTGGSGGGGGGNIVYAGGAGTADQGHAGGASGVVDTPYSAAGGGGGAGGPGSASVASVGGGGGPGLYFNISGTTTAYAGGGGGGKDQVGSAEAGGGGIGGGGRGQKRNATGKANGTASTGGGAGGDSNEGTGTGGSGVVVIRYTILNDENALADGSLHYNTDIRELEIYSRAASGWSAQDPTVNFGGHNLILYSQDFSQTGWNKSETTITANTTTAPDGSLTASKLVENSANNVHYMDISRTYVTGLAHTYSIYLKASGRSHVMMRFYSDNSVFTSSVVWFDLSAGVVGFTSSGITAAIQNAGNGWYRIIATRTTGASAVGYIGLYLSNVLGTTADSPSYSGNGSNGVFIWGGQIEQSTTAGPYVRTAGVVSPVPTVLNGYRTHTYTTVGTSGFTATTSGTVEVLVVGGGGGGANATGSNWGAGGGGGAGGLIYNMSYPVVAEQAYTVTVGTGGAGGVQGVSGSGGNGANGGNSSFGRLTAIGGGGAGTAQEIGLSGGSGGGSGYANLLPGAGTFGQGNTGGRGQAQPSSGGGGGAGGAGADGNTNIPGYGGNGRQINISGVPTYYAGGGGGGYYNANLSAATGGLGGGGNGGTPSTSVSNAGSAAVANTGGGGGGGSANSANGIGSAGAGGAGGSGVVIVRYRYS